MNSACVVGSSVAEPPWWCPIFFA